MTPQLRFADLNPVGRIIIVAIGALTFAIAAVSFAASYDALYQLVVREGLYSDRISRVYPLMLDAAFVIAELAAILGGIMRAVLGGDRSVNRGWPILVMGVTGALSIWFNLLNAGDSPSRRLVAALPPVLMILCFQVDVAIVKWVMRVLGRPLDVAPPPPGGAVYQMPGYAPAVTQNRSVHAGGNSQNGHGMSAAQQIRDRLDAMDREELGRMTGQEVALLMQDDGVTVSEGHASNILGQYRATMNGHAARRSRKR